MKPRPKTSGKAQPSAPELPIGGKGVAPVDGKFARAIPLEKEFLPGCDDTFLRRLAKADNLNPATEAPWIPAPVRGFYEIAPTVRGVIAWIRHQTERPAGLPDYFDSMQHMQDSALGTPKKFIAWALENGAGAARLGGSRISPRPILELQNKIALGVATGSVTGIDGLEQWDKDTEMAKKLEQDRIKGERENALAERRIFDLLTVEQRVRTELLSPLRDELHKLLKQFQRAKKSPETVALKIISTDLPKLLEKLAVGQPVKSKA